MCLYAVNRVIKLSWQFELELLQFLNLFQQLQIGAVCLVTSNLLRLQLISSLLEHLLRRLFVLVESLQLQLEVCLNLGLLLQLTFQLQYLLLQLDILHLELFLFRLQFLNFALVLLDKQRHRLSLLMQLRLSFLASENVDVLHRLELLVSLKLHSQS